MWGFHWSIFLSMKGKFYTTGINLFDQHTDGPVSIHDSMDFASTLGRTFKWCWFTVYLSTYLSARSPGLFHSSYPLTLRQDCIFHPRMVLSLEGCSLPQTYAAAQPTCWQTDGKSGKIVASPHLNSPEPVGWPITGIVWAVIHSLSVVRN